MGGLMRFPLLAVAVGLAVVALSFAIGAQTDDKMEVTRDVAARVGQILGGAGACRDINPVRIKSVSDKLQAVLNFATNNPNDLKALKQVYEKNLGDGERAVTSRRQECGAVERDLAGLENAIRTPTSSAASSSTGAAPAARTVVPNPVLANPIVAAAPVAPPPVAPPSPVVPANLDPTAVRGVTDDEIRFGIAAPFTGTTKDLGLQMKLGIDVAFNEANARGGANGRMLRLMSADDGYEPARTTEAMRNLYETEQVFGIIGNVGTPTAQVALPFALERRMLFYGAFSGASLLRRDPPDRYVFNYRASYVEETDAVVRYLVRLRKVRPEQIAVFAQQDGYGDAGFAGVSRALRALRGGDEGNILRLNYKRNSIDVNEAVARLRQAKGAIKAVVMVATYPAAAKFIEKTRDTYPSLIYTNVSFVGSSSLAQELMTLGPRYANGVIVTQVVPPVESYASVVLDYKNALAAYGSPGERPDYVSFEGYLSAKVLVEALRRAVPHLDTESVVDALESLRDFDIGLGVPVSFSRTEHQALHKVWGTELDANGKYQPIELE
jgi:branched-chain amino acid transport system substrate-binding protein